MRLALKIIYNILLFLFIIILFCLIYNFVNLKILKKDYTNFFGYTIFEIASGSMSPSLVEKDLVIVKINGKFNENDIITYKKDNAYITHRVVSIFDEYYVCKGDANNTNDQPIKKSDVLGKVVKILPKVGIWKNVFTTPRVIISIIITIVLFELAITYKKNKNYSDFSISGEKIIEEFGDIDEK